MQENQMRQDDVNEQIRLCQLKKGLTFGTDAYLLAAYVRGRAKARAVDLGSGTGIIPLLCLARGKAASFVASEIQPVYCELIERNAAENGMQDRLHLSVGDLRGLTSAALGYEADIVTANPPYMAPASGVRNVSDEKYLARHEVNGTIADFCAAAGRLLKHGGHFYCVFRPERLADLLAALREARLQPKRMTLVQATPLARPSMLLLEATKGGAGGMLVTPPLCLWEADTADPSKPDARMIPTAASKYLYEHCAFPDTYLNTNKRG